MFEKIDNDDLREMLISVLPSTIPIFEYQYLNTNICGYTDIFTNRIYATKDYTYNNLRGMIQNKDILVVKGDRASSVFDKRLLIKLATKCTFKFNSRFLKQVNGCTLGGPLSVTFSNIYMGKMENDVVIFYQRFLDDIYSRWKLGDNVLFDRLNNYHRNIKLTKEVNPSTFLDTKLTNISGAYKFNVYWKKHKTTFTVDLQNSKML